MAPSARPWRIVPGDLEDARVVALLAHHAESARAQTAPGSAHALDLDKLRASDISLWTICADDAVLGVGAFKRLSPTHGELKSMHVAAAFRNQGAGRAMLRHLIERARVEGLSRLSLETGSSPYFAPARALYASAGFTECGPFGAYEDDPNSIFLSRDLA